MIVLVMIALAKSIKLGIMNCHCCIHELKCLVCCMLHRIPEKFPAGSRVLVIDPMLATGTVIIVFHRFLLYSHRICNKIFLYPSTGMVLFCLILLMKTYLYSVIYNICLTKLIGHNLACGPPLFSDGSMNSN